jgi:suppressor of G2 allele of SKP1
MANEAARGKKALEAKKYDEAITEFTAALKASPTSPDYLIQRSTAYHRTNNFTAALADANNAVINAQKRAKRELIIEAQFRRGCALYGLERFGDALFVFDIVKRMDEKHKMVAIWIQKTKTTLEKLDEGDEKKQCNVQETPDSGEHKKGGSNGTAVPATPQSPPQQTPADKIRHEWYQNSDHVYFTLLAKGVPKEKTQIDIKERSLTISFPLVTGSTYDFSLEPLFGEVKVEKCIPRIFPTKIEVILAKAQSGEKWSALESNAPLATTANDAATVGADKANDDLAKPTAISESKPTGPAYPTSSKSGPKDWDKIVKDVRKAENEGKDNDGMADDDDDFDDGDETNKFFKKLFKGASPEVQKAMMKSYTESNGTALSTNWEEVSKGKVETVPPDGMEAKKWGR